MAWRDFTLLNMGKKGEISIYLDHFILYTNKGIKNPVAWQVGLVLFLPVVMTTPASTFLRAWGDVKLSVKSLNFSTTKRATASAKTCKKYIGMLDSSETQIYFGLKNEH